MIASVDKALAASGNSQTIGRNGELPLVQFLNRYLPFTIRAFSGHFVAPDGEMSPQLDVMLVDARYPLLAENSDGSVLAMLHSMLRTIEVKTRLQAKDLKKAWAVARTIRHLASQAGPDEVFYLHTNVFSYRAAQRLDTVEARYIEFATPDTADLDTFILRLLPQDQPPATTLGVELHYEPIHEDEASDEAGRWVPTSRGSHTVLSDLYYQIVQDSYYALHARGYSFGDIGQQVMRYMSWATYLG